MQLISSGDESAAFADITEFQRAVQRLENLETMPVVAQRILAVTSDPECSMNDINQVIAADQALSARVMRVANSSAFSTRPVPTLNAALIRIGLRDIRRMAVAAALLGKKTTNPFHTELWRYSLRCACLASSLAQRLNPRDVEDPFLCGLLHDFGTLVLSSVRGQEYREMVGVPGSECQCERERADLGFDHCDIGAIAATEWNLAPEFEYVMQFHHEPFAIDSLQLPMPTVRAVYLAALARCLVLAEDSEQAADGGNAEPSIAERLTERLGLTAEAVEAAHQAGTVSYEELAAALLG